MMPEPSAPSLLLLAAVSPFTRATDPSLARVLATTPEGAPAADAVVCLDGVVVGRTDAAGELVFPVAAAPLCTRAVVHDIAVRAGRGRHGREAWLRFQSYGQEPTPPPVVARVVTDRGIYLPGDTLHAVVVASTFDGAWHPASGRSVRLVFGGKMRSEQAVSACAELDAFGVAGIDLVIPPGAAPGLHRIHADGGDFDDGTAVVVASRGEGALEIVDRAPHVLPRNGPSFDFDVFLRSADGTPIDGVELTATIDPCGELEPAVLRQQGPGPHHMVLSRSVPPASQSPSADCDEGAGPDRDGSGVYAVPCVERHAGCGSGAILRIEARTDDGRWGEVRRFLASGGIDASFDVRPLHPAAGSLATAAVRLTWLNSGPLAFVPVVLRVIPDGGGRGEDASATTDLYGTARIRFAVPDVPATVDVLAPVPSVSRGPVHIRPDSDFALSVREPTEPVVEGEPVALRAVLRDELLPASASVRVDAMDPLDAIAQSFTLPIERDGEESVARGSWTPSRWGRWRLVFSTLAREREPAQVDHASGPHERTDAAGWIGYAVELDVQPARSLRLDVDLESDGNVPPRAWRAAIRVDAVDAVVPDARVVVTVVDAAFLRIMDPLARPPEATFHDLSLPERTPPGSDWIGWPAVGRNWGCERSDLAMPPFEFHTGEGCGCMGRGWGGERVGPYLCSPDYPFETVPDYVDPAPVWMPDLATSDGLVEVDLPLPADGRPRRLFVLAIDAEGNIATAIRWINPEAWDEHL